MTPHPDIAELTMDPRLRLPACRQAGQRLNKANQGYFMAMSLCPLNTLDNIFLPLFGILVRKNLKKIVLDFANSYVYYGERRKERAP